MTIRLSALRKRNQIKKKLTPPTVGVAKTFGNFDNTIAKWVGGCIAEDGNIYGAPYNSNSIIKIDPIVGTATTISAPVPDSSGNYRGIVCGQNKKLYLIPTSRTLSGGDPTDTNILEFDPKNNSYNFITSSVAGNWYGGVLANNGKIYGIPFAGSSILEFNPTVGIATTFAGQSSGFVGGVLAPNGKIYCIPFSARTVLEIDPNTGTATTFGNLSSGNKWAHGALANNGKIYGIPYDTNSVLEIDPISRTVSTFGESSDVWLYNVAGWSDGVLGADGNIYGVPSGDTSILKIDPINKTLQLINTAGIQTYNGAVVAPNGNIYTIPGYEASVLSVGVSAANKSPDWAVQPYETRPRVGFTTVLSTVGIATSANQYFGGCLAVDGNIYAMPYAVNSILKINPNTETITQESNIPSPTGILGAGFQSTIALKDGRICGVPVFATNAIFYDPKTKEYTLSNSVSGQWISGVLAENGKIYCPGYRSTRILVIDPVAGTASTSVFSPVGSANDPYADPTNWAGSVLAPNGKIYGVPSGSASVLEIDSVSGIVSTFGSLSSSNYKWWNGVLAPNGKIYCAPNAATTILKIDPIARTATTFGNTLSVISANEYIYFSILGSDGKIYYTLYNSNKILRLDPDTEQLSIHNTLNEYASFGSAVMAPNGNIYTIPAGTGISTVRAKVVSIGTTQNYAPANWMLSSYTNKSI
jgi:streptogramin lyase